MTHGSTPFALPFLEHSAVQQLVQLLLKSGPTPNCQMLTLTDKFGRAITDLRISITDRCNYKCVYCRTGNEGALYGDLPFADYLRMARVFAALGIEKVRLTGGEPLLRKGIVELVRDLAKLRRADGEPLELAVTTNGH